MNDQQLIEQALQLLEINTGVTSDYKTQQSALVIGERDDSIKLIKNDASKEFSISMVGRPTLPQLSLLLNNSKQQQTGSYENKLLLIAEYINSKAAHFLKENQCNFIDTVGNAYLNFDSVFVYITGNKAPKLAKATKPSRAFQNTGLKLIFNLLCHPEDLLNKSYRDLSAITGVSMGSIGWVFSDLNNGGYITEASTGQRRWQDKQGLIQRWVVGYAERLRPKLVLGYYKSLKANWFESVDIASFDALWGSEIAADTLTHYLKSTQATIYTDQSLGKLVLMNGLKPAQRNDAANVEIIQKFWTFKNTENPNLVPPLLIYADLIASGDARNLEVANVIYERFLNVAS